MKRILKQHCLLVLLLSIVFANGAFAQAALKDFFNNSEAPLTFLGVDFTKAKLINDPGANTMDIRNRLYEAINDVVVGEPKKYMIGDAFHKSNVTSDLSAVKAQNSKINAEQIASSNLEDFNRLKEADISAVVKSLGISKKSGVGLLFVVEAMKKVNKDDKKSKEKDMAAIWITLIDLDSKKVLLTERVECKAAGFGFRNYWASTIKEAIDEAGDRYKGWKKQYGG